MDERYQRRNQVEKLLKRFKSTGLVNPAETVWEPTPTAGDLARQVKADILADREEQAVAADETARNFWNYKKSA